jgi:hypothetical protein
VLPRRLSGDPRTIPPRAELPGVRQQESRNGTRLPQPSLRRLRLFRGGLGLVLVPLLVLALASALLRGIYSTVNLLIVLMVGVALGEPRYFVDPLIGLLRVLLGVGSRLLLQVAELTHAISRLSPGQACRLAAFPARLCKNHNQSHLIWNLTTPADDEP